MELDLPPSPPPVELTLAARRAKRQAILAKYARSTSASLSPAPSSAVQPPQSSAPESNPESRAPSVLGTPALQDLEVKVSNTQISQFHYVHIFSYLLIDWPISVFSDR